MERYDVKKEGGYEANYNAGWVTTQEDCVVLKGTRAEADLIVQALKLLVIEQQKAKLLGIKMNGPNRESSYYKKQVAYPTRLLESLEPENVVGSVDIEVDPKDSL